MTAATRQPTPAPALDPAELRTLLADLFDAVEREEWWDRALCAETDPEAFFPEKGGSTRNAKRICGACEVRTECLEYALTHDERFGVWGGLAYHERRRRARGEVAA